MKIGDFVRVKKEQPDRIGRPQYPGRVGRIVRQNQFGNNDYGGLWYVLLEATNRAKAREICIGGKHLEEVFPGDHYWTELLWIVKKRTSTCHMTDEQIIEKAKEMYLKWQAYPEGYGGFIVRTAHHAIGDRPRDDWFISRITESLHEMPRCNGAET